MEKSSSHVPNHQPVIYFPSHKLLDPQFAATSPAPWLPAISLDSEAEEEAAPTPGHSGAVLARVVTPYLGEPVEWR